MKQQSGVAHFGLLLVVVVAITVVGFTGYGVYQNNTSRADTTTTLDANQATNCFVIDQELPVDCAEL